MVARKSTRAQRRIRSGTMPYKTLSCIRHQSHRAGWGECERLTEVILSCPKYGSQSDSSAREELYRAQTERYMQGQPKSLTKVKVEYSIEKGEGTYLGISIPEGPSKVLVGFKDNVKA